MCHKEHLLFCRIRPPSACDQFELKLHGNTWPDFEPQLSKELSHSERYRPAPMDPDVTAPAERRKEAGIIHSWPPMVNDEALVASTQETLAIAAEYSLSLSAKIPLVSHVSPVAGRAHAAGEDMACTATA